MMQSLQLGLSFFLIEYSFLYHIILMESRDSSEHVNGEDMKDGCLSSMKETNTSIDDLLSNSEWRVNDLNNLLLTRGTNRYGHIIISSQIVVSVEQCDDWVILQEYSENQHALFFFNRSDKSFHYFVDGNDVGKVMEATVECYGCMDLDANGRRWEGGMMDGRPFGYGVLYDEEGRKEFEGIMSDSSRLCYGIEYYLDISQIKYVGDYYDNHRYGYGVLYDRNGHIEYDGIWNNDTPYTPSDNHDTIDTFSDTLWLSDYYSYNKEFLFIPSFLCSLKQIMIGRCCFESLRSFELDGLSGLDSVVIGEKSFVCALTGDDSLNSKRDNGSCRIVNCPKLQSIDISAFAFSNYHSFEVENLPFLHFLSLGAHCFVHSSSFSLTSLIN